MKLPSGLYTSNPSCLESRKSDSRDAISSLEDVPELTAGEQADRQRLQEIVAAEDLKTEVDWRQHLRQLWLKEGNSNTKYFHMYTSEKRRRRLIDNLNEVKVTGRQVWGGCDWSFLSYAHWDWK